MGECGSGEVVKTTKMWCIYKDDKGFEYAEPWNQIAIECEGPKELTFKEWESEYFEHSLIDEAKSCPNDTLFTRNCMKKAFEAGR